MSDALEEHDGKVSMGGRNITYLQCGDDTDALDEEEQELVALAEGVKCPFRNFTMQTLMKLDQSDPGLQY